MKRLLLLYIAVLALNGWAQTLENNVRTVLARLELDGKVEVVSVDRRVSLRPLGCEDAIRQWIEAHHSQVKKQLPLFSRWYHKSRESYWVGAKPSLHVTWRPEYGVWDAHLDKWCPRFRQPGTLLGHLALEIARNALTGHPTSQVEIWRLLNRRQPYNTDLPTINHFASDPLRVSLHHRTERTCPSMLQPRILRRCDGLPEPLGQLLPVLHGQLPEHINSSQRIAPDDFGATQDFAVELFPGRLPNPNPLVAGEFHTDAEHGLGPLIFVAG